MKDEVKAERRKEGPKHWLVKQEPTAYPWSRFVADGHVDWTGVRNFQARNSLREMRVGERVLYYHSVTEKCVVGIATVSKEAFPDPTAEQGDWSAVELRPERALDQPVPLAAMKKEPRLSNLPLLRQSRLSVVPVTKAEFDLILRLAFKATPQARSTHPGSRQAGQTGRPAPSEARRVPPPAS